eukprot:Opistho-1_new@69290
MDTLRSRTATAEDEPVEYLDEAEQEQVVNEFEQENERVNKMMRYAVGVLGAIGAAAFAYCLYAESFDYELASFNEDLRKQFSSFVLVVVFTLASFGNALAAIFLMGDASKHPITFLPFSREAAIRLSLVLALAPFGCIMYGIFATGATMHTPILLVLGSANLFVSIVWMNCESTISSTDEGLKDLRGAMYKFKKP